MSEAEARTEVGTGAQGTGQTSELVRRKLAGTRAPGKAGSCSSFRQEAAVPSSRALRGHEILAPSDSWMALKIGVILPGG